MRDLINPNDIPPELLGLYNEYAYSELAGLCGNSLLAFQTTFWNVLEPNTQYIDNWHLHYMIEHLEAVEQGQIKRLILNLPPRYMKSILCNVMFGAWLWARKPEWRMLSFSFSDALAKKFNVHRRNIVQSSLYKQMFPEVVLCGDMNTQRKMENTRTGLMLTSPMPGNATGEGGEILMVDDPHDPSGAESEAERTKQVEYFRVSMPSRLNDKKTGAIIIVMQRLHETDVSGVALELGEYVHVKLPAEERMDRTLYFPLSGKVLERKKGELLWPEREDADVLKSLAKTMGSYAYAGQYLQEPSPADGGMVKDTWWQYWTTIDEPITRYCMSVDAAFKKSAVTDFVVIQRWAIGASGRMYILDMIRERMSFLDTLEAVQQLYKRNDIVYIEDKANGSAIIDVLRRKIAGVIAYDPTESKIARLQACTPWIESGAVYLPKYAPWKDTFLNEFKHFPNGSNDDIVDCTTQMIIKIKDIRPDDLREPELDNIRHFNPAREVDGDQDKWEDELFDDFAGEFCG